MLKYIIKNVIVFVIVALVIIALSYLGYTLDMTRFVRGEFGKKCYIEGQEHKNIKKPLFFNSIDLCTESLKK